MYRVFGTHTAHKIHEVTSASHVACFCCALLLTWPQTGTISALGASFCFEGLAAQPKQPPHVLTQSAHLRMGACVPFAFSASIYFRALGLRAARAVDAAAAGAAT